MAETDSLVGFATSLRRGRDAHLAAMRSEVGPAIADLEGKILAALRRLGRRADPLDIAHALQGVIDAERFTLLRALDGYRLAFSDALSEIAAGSIRGEMAALIAGSGGLPVAAPAAEEFALLVDRLVVQGKPLAEWTRALEYSFRGRMTRAIASLSDTSQQAIRTRLFGPHGVVAGLRAQAAALAQTATSAAASEARMALYGRNHHLVKAVRHVSILDERTTAYCRRQHGKVYRDFASAPPLPAHFRCRSVYVPLFRQLAIAAPRGAAETWRGFLQAIEPRQVRAVIGERAFKRYSESGELPERFTV